VQLWTAWLRRQGYYSSSATARFGKGVEKATMRFQEAAGCFADGIVGPITTSFAEALDFPGFQSRTSSADQSLADKAGIPPDILEAVRRVESGGDSSAIRFEPHIFVRLRPDLLGEIAYTKGNHGAWSSLTRETNRAAFEIARKLDARAAIKATSWGAFQVLGQHLLDEYDDRPDKAVDGFDTDPEQTSALLLARWFQANARARRAANATPPDFDALARSYNGPRAAKHGYQHRLRKAWLQVRAAR